jgi:heme oxygenase
MMVAGLRQADPSSLRHVLKQRTRRLHDELDGALGHAVCDPEGYIGFLATQYAARAPIERWAAQTLPGELRPPTTAPLIAADLTELAASLPDEIDFAFPAGAAPIGLAWALGGSSMGNRAMLVQRRKAGFTSAERFLGDPAGAAFFRRLLPRLSMPASPAQADAAVAAAETVFRTFLAAVCSHKLEAAA